jgi:hypothetical protein
MTAMDAATRPLEEGLVEVDGEEFYLVPDVDRMAPFLMSVVSDGDRWMFVSSTGALTAGRGDASAALFPYETDDRVHASAGRIGPVTRLRVATPDGVLDWRPLDGGTCAPPCHRHLRKSVVGEAVMLEERHDDLGLSFACRWGSTERFGFVRTATLANDGTQPVRVELLDGLLGLLPHGLEPLVYQRLSNLSNAYRRSELIDPAVRLAVYSLESPVSDRAEPEEVLRATVAWSAGLDDAEIVLDGGAVRAFEDRATQGATARLTGRPGAYLLRTSVDLAPGEHVSWRIVADVAVDQVGVAGLRHRLRSGEDIEHALEDGLRSNRDGLERIMAKADSQQLTGDAVASAHHVANVTYNVMRGGVPLDGYQLGAGAFASFVERRNQRVAQRHAGWLRSLPGRLDRRDLLRRIDTIDDPHLLRLALEYLPFSFSRRHGDPSRPWNAFSIRVRDDEGKPVIHFEGNWRDVFQNWESMCASFPAYLPGVVAMFVNASTPDGHNPYRITSEGIDWEAPNPDDPWANIGYWGDHQLVYLLRLMQATDRFLPGEIAGLLTRRCFAYADVPYRIAPYDDLLGNPKSTITFDAVADAQARGRVEQLGADGKLVPGPDGEPVLVTFVEKLLVAMLAKLSNFVPGGGIWMNTQRPEWNDANNALVGYGLSMVTLFHLRQFVRYLATLVGGAPADAVVSTEVAGWFAAAAAALRESAVDVPPSGADRHRKDLLDRLGRAASDYRAGIYRAGFSGATQTIDRRAILELCETAIAHLDASIRASRRPDGLVHSYNVVAFSADGTQASVQHLSEMLEGQVAVLGAGLLSPAEQADLVDALFESDLYRVDQRSFLLAPVRRLPSFLDKNVIPAERIRSNPLLSSLVDSGDTAVVRVDADGHHRFQPDLADERALADVLDRLAAADRWRELATRHRQATLELYEHVFEHRSFLGRSGSMYAYEGIGSIYWHMVTKLLVAIQEAASAAADGGANALTVARLVDGYWRVRAGLGFNKTAIEFGAIPTDPYSHTPAHAGAQQPGMTGAVKESLLVRPRELGVRIDAGEVVFDSLFLRDSELLDHPARWNLVTASGARAELELDPGTLGLTICQVPVVMTVGSGEPSVEIRFHDGRTERRPGLRLGRDVSAALFARTGEIDLVRAAVGAAAVDER